MTTRRMGTCAAGAVLIACLALAAGPAGAALIELTGADIEAPAAIGGHSPTTPAPYVYSLAGDDLDLKTHMVFTADASSFELNMGGGAISAAGAGAATVGLATARISGNTGSIAITDVGAVTLGTIDTHTSGDFAAGNVSIGTAAARAGAVSLGAIDTSQAGGGGGSSGATRSGAIEIYSSGSVTIANGIDMTSRYVGYLTVDHVGQFSAGVIDNTARVGGSAAYASRLLSFNGGDKSGSFTATQILASCGSSHPSATVTIRNYSGVSVVPGSGLAIDISGGTASGFTTRADMISVTDIGSGGVALGDLSTALFGVKAFSGNVLLANVAGGGLTVGNIDASTADSGVARPAGNVVIYNVVGDVTVGSVSTEARRNLNSQTGDLRIGYRPTAFDGAGYATADVVDAVAGNITLTGTLNLNSAYGNTADGLVKLATSGATTITLGTAGSPNALDLSLMKSILFNAGSGTSYLYDTLSNWTTSQLIVANAGDVIYYDTSANPLLGGATFSIGGGGELKPLVPEPATVAFLAVGGVGLIGAAARRRRRA